MGLAARVGERLLVAIVSVALLVGVGLLLRWVTHGLGAWDLRTLTAIARWRGQGVVRVAHIASAFGRSWALLILAAAAGWLLRSGGRGWTPVWSVVVAIAGQNLVKLIIRRPRPPVVHLEHVTSWSFPSGHATESTALLIAVAAAAWPLVDRLRVRFAVVGAAVLAECLIAGSRLVLGVHYPTDVGAGVLLGALAATLALLGARPAARARRTPAWLAAVP